MFRRISQDTYLKTVCEGYPYKVADGEHEAEAVSRDVHGGENCRLTIVERAKRLMTGIRTSL